LLSFLTVSFFPFSIIEAASVGSFVHIGKNCVVVRLRSSSSFSSFFFFFGFYSFISPLSSLPSLFFSCFCVFLGESLFD
jgi:hypothetical protein